MKLIFNNRKKRILKLKQNINILILMKNIIFLVTLLLLCKNVLLLKTETEILQEIYENLKENSLIQSKKDDSIVSYQDVYQLDEDFDIPDDGNVFLNKMKLVLIIQTMMGKKIKLKNYIMMMKI
jgi:hypothetical protein